MDIPTYRNSFFVSVLCQGGKIKAKTKSGKRKELFRNEFLTYGVKLEENVDSDGTPASSV